MLERGAVIGAPVTAGAFDEVAEVVLDSARAGRGGYVCVANAHMAVTARRDPALRAIMTRALAVASDGMPLVWSLRRAGLDAERVAGPDLMARLCARAAEEGMPIYLYGGGAATFETLARTLAARFPGLRIAGREAPPMLPPRPARDEAARARIAASGARLVFVGLGCPKQEFWMAAQAPGLPAVLLGVGAAFDFLAGITPRAPRWMQRAGLEWLFRLICEPRRLWRRYLVTNGLFLWYLARDRLGRA
ncbi:MAG: WecB/TagA/CpsF family glycosyltransferase [Alphaproteobacteria bacterium]